MCLHRKCMGELSAFHFSISNPELWHNLSPVQVIHVFWLQVMNAATNTLFHSSYLSCLPVTWVQIWNNCRKSLLCFKQLFVHCKCSSFVHSQPVTFNILSIYHFHVLGVKNSLWKLWVLICFWESGAWRILSFIFSPSKYCHIENQLITNAAA